jgi:3-oxoacyl-[acyl-carrier-protein] synthase II
MRKVVVTGVGAISPCGLEVESTWRNILGGQSGIAPITRFDPTDYAVRIAGEVKNFEVTNFIEKKRVRESDTFIHYATAAADEAVKHSGF